jgi:hypothetical protein
MVEAMDKGSMMLLDSFNKNCMSDLEIEEKCTKFHEIANDKQL